MKKKLGIGAILGAITAVCALLGLIFYIVNANTSYFKASGIDGLIVVSFIFTIICEAVYILGGKMNIKFVDVIGAVGAGVFSVIALITLVGARIAGIASIMTFEGNASTQAMMVSAIVAIVFALIAFILSLVAAFKDPFKE